MSADLRLQGGGLPAKAAAAVHLRRRCAAGPLCSAQLSSLSCALALSSVCSRAEPIET